MPQESSADGTTEEVRELLARVRIGRELHDAARNRLQAAIDAQDLEAIERARRVFVATGTAQIGECARAGLAFLALALRGGGR
jgi:hypothetical protein